MAAVGQGFGWIGWSRARGLCAGGVSDGRRGVDGVQGVRGERAGVGAHRAAGASTIGGMSRPPCGLKVHVDVA